VPLAPNSKLPALEPGVQAALDLFVESARKAFGPDLDAVVLYGSGAEGRLRSTSDLNVLVVLAAFEPARADALAEPYEAARGAVRLRAMFLLRSELQPAAEAFAQKFADILRRRRVLFGDDPFASLAVSREAELRRLRQVLLNLSLRLREAYLAWKSDENRLALRIADSAGPLRSCAATLLELEGRPGEPPKEALEKLVGELAVERGAWALANVSRARESGSLPQGETGPTTLLLAEIAARMQERARRLA
jgi:predicted nucleotidyltransferase